MPAHLPTYPGAAQSPISPCSRWSGDPETILCLCTCPTPADTPTCLPSYMGRPAYLSTYLPTCRPAYLATRRPTCLSTNLLTCLPTYLPILGWSSPKYPNAPLWSGNKNNNLPMDLPSSISHAPNGVNHKNHQKPKLEVSSVLRFLRFLRFLMFLRFLRLLLFW